MASSPAPLPANAFLIMGPSIIGIVLNWFLYGILVMQYFIYLNHSKNEKKWIKVVVHFLFSLDTVQSVIVMDDLFYWFVYHFNDYRTFSHFNFSLIDGPFLDSIIMFTVQTVYCWRVWRLGGWRVIPAVIALLVFISCVCGIFMGVYSMVVDTAKLRKAKWVEELWLLAGAVADITIACSMAFLLTKLRQEKSTRSTMVLLKRILLLTLETNAVTAVVAIALLVTDLIPPAKEPNTNVNVTLGYIIGKLYSNCFMVLLNQRTYYESVTVSGTMSTLGSGNVSNGPDTTSIQLSTMRFNDLRTLIQLNSTSQAEPSKHNSEKDRQDSIETETEMKIASSSTV
ncbi:hypothetical protein Ac2012v2_007964 [Leucoagaricus gongylophorus]